MLDSEIMNQSFLKRHSLLIKELRCKLRDVAQQWRFIVCLLVSLLVVEKSSQNVSQDDYLSVRNILQEKCII